MARDITVDAATALEGTVVTPLLLATLTFANEVVYVHSGVGTITYNGNAYLGVGTFGGIGVISEQSDLTATGITLTLSGIPTEYLTEALDFANGSGFAQVLLAFVLADGSLVGNPFPLYGGQLDNTQIDMSADSVNITVSIENRLADMNRARGLRYTNAAQVALYPNDQSFSFVQFVADIFINWRAKS